MRAPIFAPFEDEEEGVPGYREPPPNPNPNPNPNPSFEPSPNPVSIPIPNPNPCNPHNPTRYGEVPAVFFEPAECDGG